MTSEKKQPETGFQFSGCFVRYLSFLNTDNILP